MDASPPACIGYVHKGREKPPCARMKMFLVEGDALCTSDLYYCFDCQRIWSFSDCSVDPGSNWDLQSLETLNNRDFWRHGVVENYYPEEAFADLPGSFERWVLGLKGPEYAVGPI